MHTDTQDKHTSGYRFLPNLHIVPYIVRYGVTRYISLHSDGGHARMLLPALGNAKMAHAVTMSLGIRDTIPRITAVGQAHACVYGYSLQGRPGLGVCTLLFTAKDAMRPLGERP